MQTLDREQKGDPVLHLWTREEYDQMAEAGLFLNKRVQLVEGQVVEMSLMKSTHAAAINFTVEVLRSVLPPGMHIREQQPLVLSSISEPEPDIAVVSGTIRDYVQDHPMTALLLIEISDTTLKFDRQVKGSLYARADLQDYWIVNLVDRCLEVYRSPQIDPEATYGFRYGESVIYALDQSITPLALPDKPILVSDLLPETE